MASVTWTSERLAVLRRLVEQKLSGARIGDIMGVSRQAIIGAADRARRADPTFPRLQGGPGGGSRNRPAASTTRNLSAGTPPAASRDSTGRATSSQPARSARTGGGAFAAVKPKGQLADADGVEPPPPGLTLLKLEARHCRWPLAGPIGAAQLFCGCARLHGKPYCAGHAAASVGRGTESERTADRVARRVA